MEKPTSHQTPPTADPIGEALSAFERATQARKVYLETKKNAERVLRRAEARAVARIAIARAKYDAAVGELRAVQSTNEVAA